MHILSYIRKHLVIIGLIVMGILAIFYMGKLPSKSEWAITAGEKIYTQHCANCHQPDGKGFQKLYPPLLHSPYLKDSANWVCIVQKGMSGPIVVQGQSYDFPMPPNPQLKAAEIAVLGAYLKKQFLNMDVFYTPNDIANMAKKCE